MKIVCSANMPFVKEAFETLGEPLVLEGRGISADDVRDAELLAIRSTTKVNAELLEGSRVRFVGTATIGIDHMDLEWLENHGIGWCFSPGCNANSVSEYVTAALLHIAVKHGLTLEGQTMGIIGIGNVGSRVVSKAHALGMKVLACDPPRARGEQPVPATESGPPPDFVPLDRVLAESDIISLHVPLTREGRDATCHVVDRDFLARTRPGVIFLNAARGPVVETGALIEALDSGQVADAVIDTWEGEPDFRPDLLERVELGTPHIAGHSFEGKVQGTVMVYEAACKFLHRPVEWSVEPLLPEPLVPSLTVTASDRRDEEVLQDLVKPVYDICADDRALRGAVHAEHAQRRSTFDGWRRHYPMRREFRFTEVKLSGAAPSLRAKVEQLGFTLGPPSS